MKTPLQTKPEPPLNFCWLNSRILYESRFLHFAAAQLVLGVLGASHPSTAIQALPLKE